MDLNSAEHLLYHDTMDNEGTFTLLRMGKDPGADRILNLRKALRIIFHEYATHTQVPREIASSCGAILYFASESDSNITNHSSENELRKSELRKSVRDLQQGAYDLLEGDVAYTWIVKRPDLGE